MPARCRRAADESSYAYAAKRLRKDASSKSSISGKSGNVSARLTFKSGCFFFGRSKVGDESLPRAAGDRAWTIYLAAHADVDPADHRRCALQRYLHSKWQAGESDPEELTCSGLSYLSRIRPDSW